MPSERKGHAAEKIEPGSQIATGGYEYEWISTKFVTILNFISAIIRIRSHHSLYKCVLKYANGSWDIVTIPTLGSGRLGTGSLCADVNIPEELQILCILSE